MASTIAESSSVPLPSRWGHPDLDDDNAPDASPMSRDETTIASNAEAA
jgi:hypothetical protein